MSSKVRIIIISAAAGAAVVSAGIFGIYKYFVTPERVVLLSALDIRDELDSALGYIDETDLEILEHCTDDGGKLTLSLKASEESMFAGMPVNIKVNSDGQCSVSEIGLHDRFKFETYKDSGQLLISTPLFSGGFRLPVNNFAEEWNGSVFGSVFPLPEGSGAAEILSGFISGSYELSDFIEEKSGGLKAASQTVRINKEGKSNVTVDNKTESAGVYTMHLSRDLCGSVLKELADYICSTPAGTEKVRISAEKKGITEAEAREDIFNELSVLGGEYDVTMKIDDLKLRELEICRDGGDTYTVSLQGKRNVFDEVMVYKNGDVHNAVRRVVTGSNGSFSDSISVGSATVLTAEADRDGFELRYDMDDVVFGINAYGRTGTETSMSFSNIDININDTIMLTGSAELSEEYDSDFGFSKSGEYIDLLDISAEDWEAVSGTVLAAFGLISETGN